MTVAEGRVYFVNDRDQDIYVVEPGTTPRRITDKPSMRFADVVLDASRRRLIAVCEKHTAGPHQHPENLLVSVDLANGTVTELASGSDFYANPRLSTGGETLAYLAWDLPDMPWDSATLHVSDIGVDGMLSAPRRVAGGKGSAVFQPAWGPDGLLYYVDDVSGWGQLYRLSGDTIARVHPPREADLTRPMWNFHASSYALHPDGRIAMIFLERGRPMLRIQLKSGDGIERDLGFARMDEPTAFEDGFAVIACEHVAPPALVKVTAGRQPAIVHGTKAESLDVRGVSKAETIEIAGPEGRTIYGLYYPPTSATHQGPPDALPPALILAHGGPTSMAPRGLSMRTQYYTSRGFAVLDVDYAGSTGYGRAYRERLDGNWGIADVADCVAAARWLADGERADPRRIGIAGGSAGGYTVLQALATTAVFAAGSSHYGISDLGLLMEHTHKFEAGYLHRLLGTTPEHWQERCRERSPLTNVDRISSPLVLFQGLEDKVVPPEQSRLIADRLRRKGIKVELHEFAGESHGFRRADTIIAVLERELAFLMSVMGISAASS